MHSYSNISILRFCEIEVQKQKLIFTMQHKYHTKNNISMKKKDKNVNIVLILEILFKFAV